MTEMMAALKRVHREYDECLKYGHTCGIVGINHQIIDGDDVYCAQMSFTLIGPIGSHYSGHEYEVMCKFTKNYPFEAPDIVLVRDLEPYHSKYNTTAMDFMWAMSSLPCRNVVYRYDDPVNRTIEIKAKCILGREVSVMMSKKESVGVIAERIYESTHGMFPHEMDIFAGGKLMFERTLGIAVYLLCFK